MKSLKTNDKNISKIERKIKKTGLDLKAIEEEHEIYKLKTEKDVYIFLDSLPIETLKESIDKDLNKPRTKFSMKDLIHLNALHKKHEIKESELNKLKSDLFVAKIDKIQKDINSILENI